MERTDAIIQANWISFKDARKDVKKRAKGLAVAGFKYNATTSRLICTYCSIALPVNTSVVSTRLLHCQRSPRCPNQHWSPPTCAAKKRLLLDLTWHQKYKVLSLNVCIEAAVRLRQLFTQPTMDSVSTELAIAEALHNLKFYPDAHKTLTERYNRLIEQRGHLISNISLPKPKLSSPYDWFVRENVPPGQQNPPPPSNYHAWSALSCTNKLYFYDLAKIDNNLTMAIRIERLFESLKIRIGLINNEILLSTNIHEGIFLISQFLRDRLHDTLRLVHSNVRQETESQPTPSTTTATESTIPNLSNSLEQPQPATSSASTASTSLFEGTPTTFEHLQAAFPQHVDSTDEIEPTFFDLDMDDFTFDTSLFDSANSFQPSTTSSQNASEEITTNTQNLETPVCSSQQTIR